MTDSKCVLVYAECTDDGLTGTATELLGSGRQLADGLGQPLWCVLPRDASGTAATDAIARGADGVYVLDPTVDDADDVSAHLEGALAAVEEATPSILLIGHTALGRQLGPRLGFRLGTGVATDCIDIRIDESGSIVLTKPVYGGNALADFTATVEPQIATVRPKAMSPIEPDSSRKGDVIPLAHAAGTTPVEVIEKVREEVAGVKLEEAPVIVSGGRGTGGPEPFDTVLKELADILHGAVGASRPPCDTGWAPETMHIGLTGKIVAPDIYIAVAISGASQHMAGCSGAKTIVAINKDPEANIFREAQYGVVGRYQDVLPAFTSKLRELLAG
ncbi:MAG: electron transfer flavoprotein subunit alpha/FixB family protein [Chloroflexota bacterium]